MKVDKVLCLFTGGYILGGYLCKPDTPTRAWAIGFVLLLISTIAAHIFAPKNG